jgi:catechol 2,3-dioxygenase-like lactoylglutathione lyase family enzyme
MTVALNHTIVHATNKQRSAVFLGNILGIEPSPEWGHFAPLVLDNGVALDFIDGNEFDTQHYAFLVDEADFDAIFERILASGTGYYADPGKREKGKINHHFGGRGVYFDDPDGHLMEIITQPYET